jgi:hypothetical protein
MCTEPGWPTARQDQRQSAPVCYNAVTLSAITGPFAAAGMVASFEKEKIVA